MWKSRLHRVCLRSRREVDSSLHRLLLLRAAWAGAGTGRHRGPCHSGNLRCCRKCQAAGEAAASAVGRYLPRGGRDSQAVVGMGASALGRYLSLASWWAQGHRGRQPNQSRLDLARASANTGTRDRRGPASSPSLVPGHTNLGLRGWGGSRRPVGSEARPPRPGQTERQKEGRTEGCAESCRPGREV